MFTSPAPPSSGTFPPLTTSSSRGSRLRDLINLRNYTHSHLLSRESPDAGLRHNHNRNHTHNSNSNTVAPTNPVPSSSSPPNTREPQTHNPIRPRSHTSSGITQQDHSVSAPTPPQKRRGSLLDGLGLGNRQNTSLDQIVHLQSAVSLENAVEPLSRSRTAPDLEYDGGSDEQQPATVMTRTRSATTGDSSADMLPSIRFSAFYDPRSNRPSLSFSPMSRTLPTGKEVIKVGRYSERENHPPVPTNAPSAAPVGFKSKVVSRRHCEFWFEKNKWYIRDVKSSSGTFLNHIRLSAPGTESKPFAINDGDIVQLGIDFKGGEEMIYRCVKMRIELNRGWQAKPNSFKYVIPTPTAPLSRQKSDSYLDDFLHVYTSDLTCNLYLTFTFSSMATHKRLRNMTSAASTASHAQDCSICLNAIAVRTTSAQVVRYLLLTFTSSLVNHCLLRLVLILGTTSVFGSCW